MSANFSAPAAPRASVLRTLNGGQGRPLQGPARRATPDRCVRPNFPRIIAVPTPAQPARPARLHSPERHAPASSTAAPCRLALLLAGLCLLAAAGARRRPGRPAAGGRGLRAQRARRSSRDRVEFSFTDRQGLLPVPPPLRRAAGGFGLQVQPAADPGRRKAQRPVLRRRWRPIATR